MKNYNLETKEAIDKFFEFLKIYITKVKDKLDEIESDIDFYNKIKAFRENKDISSLLALNVKNFDEIK